eukprot:gene7728-12198_t
MNFNTKLNEKLLIFCEFNSKVNQISIKRKKHFEFPNFNEIENEMLKIVVLNWKEFNEELFSFNSFLKWDTLLFSEKYTLWRKIKEKKNENSEIEIIEEKRQKSIFKLTHHLYLTFNSELMELLNFYNKSNLKEIKFLNIYNHEHDFDFAMHQETLILNHNFIQNKLIKSVTSFYLIITNLIKEEEFKFKKIYVSVLFNNIEFIEIDKILFYLSFKIEKDEENISEELETILESEDEILKDINSTLMYDLILILTN